jgi:hypothetical protein
MAGETVSNNSVLWRQSKVRAWARCKWHGKVDKTFLVNGEELCGRRQRIGRGNGPVCGRPIERVPYL